VVRSRPPPSTIALCTAPASDARSDNPSDDHTAANMIDHPSNRMAETSGVGEPGVGSARLRAPPPVDKASSAIICLGIILRLVQLLNGRPLWLDEAMLSLNILSRPFPDLFRPLDAAQMSPLGFLWGQWTMTRLAGSSELALRVIPFIAGVAALIAFNRLARRVLEPRAAFVATALAALSPLLIRYSAEAKPYGFDALTTIVLMHATLDIAEKGTTSRLLLRWALAAACAALISIPAPFTVIGCAAALLVVPHVHRATRTLGRGAQACMPAAAVVTLQMLTVYRSSETTVFMQGYWADSFLALDFTLAVRGLTQAIEALWLRLLLGAVGQEYLPKGTLSLVLILAAAGSIALARRAPHIITLLFAPLLCAVCAAFAQRWPLTPRLLLFVAPGVFMTVAAGASAAVRLIPVGTGPRVFTAVAAVVISSTAIGALSEQLAPPKYEPVPAVMAEVGAHHASGATVYVSGYLVPACSYYSTWHPAHTQLTGDSASRTCSIRNARTVLGEWAVHEHRPATMSADSEPPVSTKWLANESQRILATGAGELWLLLKQGPYGTNALRSALFRAGAVRTAEWERSGIVIERYRMPSNPRMEPAGPR
jgi:uncharacterized membrane protein